ncbi:hypothetical protein AVEN_57828-1 [Araneus ventricosus]|uniref:Uncharacterized protein n=1 Tax=Araneus ventricosus TaxID=182803 RepID=A0A4Y2I959_ARAVE|nr:hypothetical protein AVEN_57828-1 [Araneus ventricosus]
MGYGPRAGASSCRRNTRNVDEKFSQLREREWKKDPLLHPNLLDSMPRRCQAVIESAKGFATELKQHERPPPEAYLGVANLMEEWRYRQENLLSCPLTGLERMLSSSLNETLSCLPQKVSPV